MKGKTKTKFDLTALHGMIAFLKKKYDMIITSTTMIL